jgi:hypothetical protein
MKELLIPINIFVRNVPVLESVGNIRVQNLALLVARGVKHIVARLVLMVVVLIKHLTLLVQILVP